MKRNFALFVLCSIAVPSLAWAGGFEIPDNGTEALGRGGAFVAKADDGTAMEYNVAGLARQDGFRVYVGANLIFHDVAFTAAGSYDGGTNPSMAPPYAGQPYPTVHDTGGPFPPVPFLSLSYKLPERPNAPWLHRFTIGFAVYAPPSVGTHNYGVGSNDTTVSATDANGKMYMASNPPPATVTLANGMVAPNPARYSLASANLLIVTPTLALAAEVTKWLDLGIAGQIVYANLALSAANYTPLGPSSCGQSGELAACDAYALVNVSGMTGALLLSAMAHPTSWLDLGATVSTGADINASGSIHAVPAPNSPANLPDYNAGFTTHLPWWARLGGRYIARRADGTEQGDLELDLTYENWSSEKTDTLTVPDFPLSQGGNGIVAGLIHNYRDTYGVRLGGAYNHRVSDKIELTGRLGVYFDSAATHYQDTNIDFNTMAKYAGTIGGGLRYKGFTVNLAYAYVYSPDRNVTNSELVALSATDGTPVGRDKIITVGNGLYQASTQMLSLALKFETAKF